MRTSAQGRWPKPSKGIVVLWGILLLVSGCSTPPAPPSNPGRVREHADKAFQQLHDQEQPQAQREVPSHPQSPATSDQPATQSPSNKAGVQIPLAEIGQSDDGYVRATGYGSLAKGLYLCQHSADLAARVELSKLIRVKVTERSTDRDRAPNRGVCNSSRSGIRSCTCDLFMSRHKERVRTRACVSSR